jgi:hypothetical protein
MKETLPLYVLLSNKDGNIVFKLSGSNYFYKDKELFCASVLVDKKINLPAIKKLFNNINKLLNKSGVKIVFLKDDKALKNYIAKNFITLL